MEIGNSQHGRRVMLIGSTVFVCALLLTLFFVLAPAQRTRDEQRISDMEMIVRALESFARQHDGVYPEYLDILVKRSFLRLLPVDPATHEPYRYVLSGTNEHTVCARLDDHTERCIAALLK